MHQFHACEVQYLHPSGQKRTLVRMQPEAGDIRQRAKLDLSEEGPPMSDQTAAEIGDMFLSGVRVEAVND